MIHRSRMEKIQVIDRAGNLLQVTEIIDKNYNIKVRRMERAGDKYDIHHQPVPVKL